MRIGTASANEYEYLYNSADDNPSSANPSDTFAVRNLLQVNGIEFRTGEVKTTPKKKNNDVEANSSDKPHDSIASDFAFTSLPFSAAPYLPTHLSSHNYQNTPVSAISNSGMSVNNNVPQQFGLDTIKEQSLTIENSEVLENSKENFGRSPIKENNQQSQNTNSEHESPGSLWNSPFNNSSGMLVSPFGSPQKAWHQD